MFCATHHPKLLGVKLSGAKLITLNCVYSQAPASAVKVVPVNTLGARLVSCAGLFPFVGTLSIKGLAISVMV